MTSMARLRDVADTYLNVWMANSMLSICYLNFTYRAAISCSCFFSYSSYLLMFDWMAADYLRV